MSLVYTIQYTWGWVGIWFPMSRIPKHLQSYVLSEASLAFAFPHIVRCHKSHLLKLNLVQTALVAQTFYNLCIPTIKISILTLYSRIFSRTTGWFTPTLYVSAIFVALYSIPQVLTYIFQCVPIRSLWERVDSSVCINFKDVIVVFGIINIVTDWAILALPLPVVAGLKMERRTKFSISALFLLGGL
jgi:hypothetical protein